MSGASPKCRAEEVIRHRLTFAGRYSGEIRRKSACLRELFLFFAHPPVREVMCVCPGSFSLLMAAQLDPDLSTLLLFVHVGPQRCFLPVTAFVLVIVPVYYRLYDL